MRKVADSSFWRDRLVAREMSLIASALATTCAMRGKPPQRFARFPFAIRLALNAGTIAALAIGTALPALADGGHGGAFAPQFGFVGGAGGTGFTGNPGANGTTADGGGG